jgi:hypothetical protein
MKTLLTIIMSLVPVAASAATVAVLPVTPYRSLADSPWKEAVTAGDALKFRFGDCNEHAPTLPSGFGVHDNFEDRDCYSPWARITKGTLNEGNSIRSDLGVPGNTPFGTYFAMAYAPDDQQYIGQISFILTSDGMLPSWVGFGVVHTNALDGPVFADILGTGSTLLSTINLTSYLGNYRGGSTDDDVFLGFFSDTPVESIVFRGLGGVTLDHFQYGYGTPIPEPTLPPLTALALAATTYRRRRAV